MDEMNFGDVLRQAREQSGEDLVSVARRIRIRPDILERIEASDIESMPPRGYSRNMINAYARYLGLNTTEIVKMYQNAQYRNQVEHARENIKPLGFEMPSTRRESVRERHQDEPRHGHASERANAGERRYSDRLSGTGTRHDARSSRRSSDGFDNALFDDIDASIAPPKETTNRIGAVHVGSYNAYGQGLSQRNARRSADQTRRIEPVDSHRHDPHSTHRARRSTMPAEHYTNLYAAPKNIGVRPPSWRDKIPFIIAGVIILLLVILIAVIANGMGRAETTDNQPAPMNVTGLPGSSTTQSEQTDSQQQDESSEDSSQSQDEGKQSSSGAQVAPTKTVMAYEIPDGVTTYMEVYVDGKYVDGGDITGPKTQSYDVTGTFKFVVVPPDGVKLTQDGTEVALDANSGGVAKVSVDFADVLAKWQEEHPDAAASS